MKIANTPEPSFAQLMHELDLRIRLHDEITGGCSLQRVLELEALIRAVREAQ